MFLQHLSDFLAVNSGVNSANTLCAIRWCSPEGTGGWGHRKVPEDPVNTGKFLRILLMVVERTPPGRFLNPGALSENLDVQIATDRREFKGQQNRGNRTESL